MPERLRAILSHFGLTQSQAGELLGFRHSIISNWLAGKNEMPQSTAMAFQAALGVRWEWLLHGTGKMLLDDMGKLSPEEVRLLTVFRHSDLEAREEIISQAEFQLGRSKRRGDTK
jgi:transcriptional regulator with XRE-family HTH domain